MLLAACFGSAGKMQTMDTIRNHGGDHINLFLCQFCVGVQKPGKTVHYKNQDRTDIFILRRLDVITFDLFQTASRKCCVKRFIADAGNHAVDNRSPAGD